MTLSDYIIQLGGYVRAAKQLGIAERAARSYQYKARKPRPQSALQIVRKSKGALTFQDIYESR